MNERLYTTQQLLDRADDFKTAKQGPVTAPRAQRLMASLAANFSATDLYDAVFELTLLKPQDRGGLSNADVGELLAATRTSGANLRRALPTLEQLPPIDSAIAIGLEKIPAKSGQSAAQAHDCQTDLYLHYHEAYSALVSEYQLAKKDFDAAMRAGENGQPEHQRAMAIVHQIHELNHAATRAGTARYVQRGESYDPHAQRQLLALVGAVGIGARRSVIALNQMPTRRVAVRGLATPSAAHHASQKTRRKLG
jgi:hypothetical protein